METLTRRQTEILDMLRLSVADRGYPPTIREIGDAVGLASTGSVAHQLRELERKGWILRDSSSPRTLTIIAASSDGETVCRTTGCGHLKRDHVYQEGSCRPGFICEADCRSFTTTPTPSPDPFHVTQTILASTELEDTGVYGNCLQAAVASLLGRPLDAVPHFLTFRDWPSAMRIWCTTEQLTVRQVGAGEDIPAERCILIGRSPRGYGHACIGVGGVVVWDPHPSRDGLTFITGAIVINPVLTEES
jgi:hypothetical protein